MSTYPRDIASAISDIVSKRSTPLYSDENSQCVSTPSANLLASALDAVFFASLLGEEGDATPIATVLAPGGIENLTSGTQPWSVIAWPSVALESKALRKLALTSAPGDSYLVIAESPSGLRIQGVAFTPASQGIFSSDQFVRITTTGPGSIVIEQGDREILRYVGGEAVAIPNHPFETKPHAPALVSLYKPLTSSQAIVFPYLIDNLLRAVNSTGRGGMLAFSTGPEDDLTALMSTGRRLDNCLEIGTAFGDAMDDIDVSSSLQGARVQSASSDPVLSPPTAATEDAEFATERSSAWLDRLVAQTGRLSAVDGAVILLPELRVGAFACKIPINNTPPEVLKVLDWPKREAYDESRHGTRHRAAAAFVAEDKGRLALCVSQDGPVSAFFWVDNELLCWPMLAPRPWHRR